MIMVYISVCCIRFSWFCIRSHGLLIRTWYGRPWEERILWPVKCSFWYRGSAVGSYLSRIQFESQLEYCPDWYSSLQDKCSVSTLIRPRLLPSRSFWVHLSSYQLTLYSSSNECCQLLWYSIMSSVVYLTFPWNASSLTHYMALYSRRWQQSLYSLDPEIGC